MYQHLGLVSAVLLFFGLLFVVRHWPYGINRTFSQHVARHKDAIIFYSIMFMVVLPLLLLFMLKWFIPTFELTAWFTVLVVFAAALQLGCTLVPEVGGTKSTIHRALAFLSADLLLPAVVLLSVSSSISAPARISAAVMAVVMMVIIAVMIKNNAEHKYLLILQSVYFGAFFSTLLIATYTA